MGPPQRGTGYWAHWRSKNSNLPRESCHNILALHWAGETGRKTHKKSPCLGAKRKGQYKRIMVVQTTPLDHASNQANIKEMFATGMGKLVLHVTLT